MAPAPPAPPPLSAQLRDGTRRAHAGVEMAFALDVRLADRAAYGTLLTALRGFYGPAEDAVGAVAGWNGLAPGIDVAGRRRAGLLDEDLERLGLPLGAADAGPSPVLAELGSLPRGLGCLYVLEGSALGGRIVARRARAALGGAVPVAFFSSAGRTDLGDDWRRLQVALDSFGTSEGQVAGAEAVVAANQTFAALTAWLDLRAPRR